MQPIKKRQNETRLGFCSQVTGLSHSDLKLREVGHFQAAQQVVVQTNGGVLGSYQTGSRRLSRRDSDDEAVAAPDRLSRSDRPAQEL